MPIQMYYFNTISLYSVFANILTVPFLSIVSFCGFVSSILAPIKGVGTHICMVMDFVLNPFLTVIVEISEFFAKLPNSLIITSHPSLYQVFFYYLLVSSLVLLFKKTINKKFWLSVWTLLLVLFLVSFVKIPNKNFELLFFDVQNADCILLKTPSNDYFMIDTGKSGYNDGKSQAEYIVKRYLQDNGIKHLNSIIITHFDNDHAGGAVDLIEYGKPEKVYVNSLKGDTFTGYKIFKKLSENPKTKVCLAKNNELIYEDKNIKITNFFADFGDDEDNDNSIITLIEAYGKSLLLTGDAGVKAFEKIGFENFKDVDILKVPHHAAGGVLNKEIVEIFSPEVSIVSVGRNMYGHPSPKTLDLLESSDIYRTDVNHALKLIVSSKGYQLYHWDTKVRSFKKLYK